MCVCVCVFIDVFYIYTYIYISIYILFIYMYSISSSGSCIKVAPSANFANCQVSIATSNNTSLINAFTNSYLHINKIMKK